VTRYVLGVSALYHDSAATLVGDGEIIAAAQEERFSRKRHDPSLPRNAINYCLEEAFIENNELGAVAFYDNPWLTFDRALSSVLSVGSRGKEQWLAAAPSLLGAKLRVKQRLHALLQCEVPVLFTQHHLAHAASAYFPSPFADAAVLTMDGVGEWATTSLGMGTTDAEGRTRLELLREIRYPDSLGLLYSAMTQYCGFKVNSGEYKLMGLAPYGTPRYATAIKQNLIELLADGSFRLNTEYFGFLDEHSMTNERFAALFGGPARRAESRITRREMDLAASIQAVLEEAVLGLARSAHATTGAKRLCLAGGVALNCVANGRLLREGPFAEIWIQPAAGDAGGALGAALLCSFERFDARRKLTPGRDAQKGSYLGPAYGSAQVKAFIERHELPSERVEDLTERSRRIAGAIADGKIVGFFAGRMEFGPRALGARSILGDPRSAATQSQMNLKIKFRESFRPFAPAVLREHCADLFELDADSPYMLLVAPVRAELRLPKRDSAFEQGDDDLLSVVREARSTIPAVTHVDYSARIQTVDSVGHPAFRALIEAFFTQTGCPVLVNTSFNVRGEPIVCTPQDAYRCFMRTEIELLVLEDYLLWKDQQPKQTDDESWRDEFELD
jgi:carbamoyltransferase